ncbi:hypothetical protein T07_11203 [Trichinella nelsoni]|uniref:Uncharacterized protein n=1 Tax=Trichinella nelsoni TaxID=6336 RepID=A0A0V0SMI4_9BILA|nr:hypothetical protein T07_11203 [Trichinella nelsoni]
MLQQYMSIEETVSVYSAPLKADAIFSLNYNRRLSILCTSNYPALQCASTIPFAIALANFAISFFYFFYFSIQSRSSAKERCHFLSRLHLQDVEVEGRERQQLLDMKMVYSTSVTT